MSWLGWIIAALILSPLWWRVAQHARRVDELHGDKFGGLPAAIYKAAAATAALIALFAIAEVLQHLGISSAENTDLGLF